MPLKSLFPTAVFHDALPAQVSQALNRQLSEEILLLADEDTVGQAWSDENYLNGYSSYSSVSDCHRRSPTFAQLEALLRPALHEFAASQHWSLDPARLQMSTCWVNVMGPGCYHTSHIHPHALVSGVYWVEAQPDASPLRLEDPRLERYMNDPPRSPDAPESLKLYHAIPALAGEFVLFNSWLRHEVPPNLSDHDRLSVSFNFDVLA